MDLQRRAGNEVFEPVDSYFLPGKSVPDIVNSHERIKIMTETQHLPELCIAVGRRYMAKRKKRPMRGQQGYVDTQKAFRIRKTLCYVLAGIGIFVLGLCLNKFEKSNIFTVFAVLTVLPATKALISVIVLLPYRSVEKERVEKVRGLLLGEDVMYTDVVFTSREKIMFASFLVITQDEVLCLAGREKEDTAYMEKYLGGELKKRMFGKKLYITKDEKKFHERVAHSAPAQEIKEELVLYLKSLMV